MYPKHVLVFRTICAIRSLDIRCLSRIARLKTADDVNSSPGIARDPASEKTLSSTLRSHTCGELRLEHVGSKVSLCGWVHRVRFGKFLLLRDTYGVVQIIQGMEEPHSKHPFSFPQESVVRVVGTVAARPEKNINKGIATGRIEVLAEKVTLLNAPERDLAFSPADPTFVNEPLRLTQRYLDLRTPQLQRNLKLRSDVLLNMRQFLSKEYDFVEIETPYLFRRTPGGAKEFITPSNFPGHFYSLPQSPQQFKQLLMVGGFDRYMQIARCFRDEPSKADRQPEFTQLDLEMAFVDSNDVMAVIENTLASVWPVVQKFQSNLTSLHLPFPRMSYSDAMRQYGSDKPDIRFGFKFSLIDSIDLVGFKIPSDMASHFTQADWIRLENNISAITNVPILHANTMTGDEELGQLIQELDVHEGDSVVYVHGTSEAQLKALGHARLFLASLLESNGVKIYEPGIHFLWISDFPLFEKSDTGAWVSVHHPFTAPTPETLPLIYSDPSEVISQHYDLVCNGQEIGGGSIRIHDAQLQKYVLSDILQEDVSTMSYFLEALASGAPPHGGIALGLDRLIAILSGASSIREVIAFPKVAGGKDLMCGAPAPVPAQELKHYKLALLPND